MAIAAVILFAGCDKIKDATRFDVTVKNASFTFDAPVEDAVLRSAVNTQATDWNTFSVIRTIKSSEISAELEKYGNKVSDVIANASTVHISCSQAGNYTVTDLSFSYSGGTLSIPSYTLGGTFVPPSGLNAFISLFALKLFTTGEVEVTVSGKTDAPAGTAISIRYENELVATVNPL